MDDYTRLRRKISNVAAAVLFILFAVGLGAFIGLQSAGLNSVIAGGVSVVIAIIISISGGYFLANIALKPLYILWRSITLLSDKSQTGGAPQADQLKIGRELVTNLLSQLYELASSAGDDAEEDKSHISKVVQSVNIVSHMPLPLFVFNKELLVTNASDSGLAYCKLESAELFGKKLNESINLDFPSDRTLEAWIDDCIVNKITDTAYWERVRVVLTKGEETSYRRCDMAAYYNKDNPSGTEFIVTMFDRTEQYQQDDNSMSFVALAVHELRTPLTMMRGYLEILSEELDDKIDPEMKGFLQKMDLSARQLNSFVGNILNVSKVDENALVLHLEKADWSTTLQAIIQDLQSKATSHGKVIELHISKDIPEVAIDQISVTEVVNNLIDNAIKYGREEKQIIVRSTIGKDGLIETTVQDFGLGIPESVVPHIFEKFYRNHRTKAQVGGNGLGLYLAKSLVNAHGGQIWVSSKPNEGSTFGFSLQPYEMVDQAGKQSGEDELTRTAHGWIKNHSLYRR